MKTIIFDMDGTIINSEKAIESLLRSLRALLRRREGVAYLVQGAKF